jgi:hypothetical protein
MSSVGVLTSIHRNQKPLGFASVVERVPLVPKLNLGNVVRHLEAALKHWTTVLGVGPFFYVERARIADLKYKGKSSTADVTV